MVVEDIEVPGYDADASCIKCGSDDIRDAHHKDYRGGTVTRVCFKRFYDDASDHRERQAIRETIDEHIHRTCNNCGYDWPERPLDHAES